MIDRVWWTWQNLDPEKRTSVVAGTLTRNNNPPSRNATLDDFLNLGVLETSQSPMTIGQAASTLGLTGNPFCYVYE